MGPAPLITFLAHVLQAMSALDLVMHFFARSNGPAVVIIPSQLSSTRFALLTIMFELIACYKMIMGEDTLVFAGSEIRDNRKWIGSGEEHSEQSVTRAS